MKLKILIFLLACFAFKPAEAKLIPTQLTCEYLKNLPLVDVPHPRLAWINIAESGERGQQQTAFQIRVATSASTLENPDMWDSGKVKSDQSTRVEYNGKTLMSRQECWWQVRVWDRNNKVSEWSEPVMWRMGLLQATDWKAEWIGAPWQGEEALSKQGNTNTTLAQLPPPAPLFRKEFVIQKKIAKAVAFVTGLGYFELYVNGEKVGDDVLVPNQTNYGKRPGLIDAGLPLKDDFREYRVMYLAYDVTKMLRNGTNVVGSILGNGFYNPSKSWAEGYGSPRFLGQIHIAYTDGTEDVILSDQTWKASKSAILMDMVYYGEHYDARLEQPSWCSPGFDDSKWEPVAKRKAPEGKLVTQTSEPDKVTLRIPPRSIEKTAEGNYKVDFGVEISGRLRLNDISGPAGQKIEIKYLCNTYSGDNSYICKGGGSESYASRFNWFVFSAVEITNWPGELKPENLSAEAVNTSIEESAKFETSNSLFNDINKAWKRSQLDNMHGGIASDCPHRERSGYTGDGQVACVTMMHNFDAKSFYFKWIKDILGAQNVETGYVPNGAPWQPGCGGGVAWGAAIAIMPWEFYLHYGDLDMLADNYEGMKGYIRYMQSWVGLDGTMFSQRPGKDGKPLQWFNLGEWSAPGKTVPDNMVHTFYFWRCADLTAKTARAMHKTDEANQYAELAERTREAFHKKFYDEKNGTYGSGGGNIFALKMGVPAEQYFKVVSALRADIKANDGHLDTGIFGTQFFFEVLSENGMHDLAYEALNKRTMPSFGYGLAQGATTTWEQWNGENSQNHPMFGGGLVWFYRKLAGMNTDPDQPGYRHIIFKPQPVADLQYVTYSTNTSYGEAGINWKNKDGKFLMDIAVPVGSKATVFVPSGDIKSLKESSHPIKQSKGVHLASTGKDTIVLDVESGKYQFEVNK
ncbi:MAG: family 78 glycoside hydrolase catalytic domain [Prolixibacteraceae bacterium]|nr:family 78 glycoside hydrolase catalytic domain [Prolixibacteraceae bacterium]